MVEELWSESIKRMRNRTLNSREAILSLRFYQKEWSICDRKNHEETYETLELDGSEKSNIKATEICE